MVTLRRAPRLQRQCTIKLETAKDEKPMIRRNSINKKHGLKSKTKKPDLKSVTIKPDLTSMTTKPGLIQKENHLGNTQKQATGKRKHPNGPKTIIEQKVHHESRTRKRPQISTEENTPLQKKSKRTESVETPLQTRRSMKSRVEFKSPSQKIAEMEKVGTVFQVGALNKTPDKKTKDSEINKVITIKNSNKKRTKTIPLMPPDSGNLTPKAMPKTASKSPKPTPKKAPKSPKPTPKTAIKSHKPTPKTPKSPKSTPKIPKSPKSAIKYITPSKPERKSSESVFKVPRTSCSRRKQPSDVALLVEREENSYSLCALLMNKHKKRTSDTSATELSSLSPKNVIGTREQEKLNVLEKSMNLFQCPISPITSSSESKDTIPLKSQFKQTKKSEKSQVKSKRSQGSAKFQKRAKKAKLSSSKETSLLKTPLRNVFHKSSTSLDSSLFDSVSDEDESGFTMFPLSDDIVKPKTKPKPKHDSTKPKMDYDKWLEEHTTDYGQLKDLPDLCVE